LEQLSHAVAAVELEYLPGIQFSQVIACVAASVLENFPIPQSKHTVAPGIKEYFPAGHERQKLKFIMPSTVEKRPIGHNWHVVANLAFVAALHLPAWHKLQLASSAKEYVPGPQDFVSTPPLE
jgi:hypothetical protein